MKINAEVQFQSLYVGLDDLQQDFVRAELSKNRMQSVSRLRRIAKNRAFFQRMLWKLDNVIVLSGFILGIAAIVLTYLILRTF